jgi:hypothetical protein
MYYRFSVATKPGAVHPKRGSNSLSVGDEARAELADYGNTETRIGQMEGAKCREST